jgi:hypothetical protein
MSFLFNVMDSIFKLLKHTAIRNNIKTTAAKKSQSTEG